ncbi:hypothetical protein XELAEV_18002323mg, partial [Xenopus laevis]
QSLPQEANGNVGGSKDTGMGKKDKNEEEERGKKERMVNLTLEMIYLLTGEHYIPRKKSDDGGALHAPGSVIQKENNKNDKKILELMSNIIQLLTGEVAIRTHHVSIYFSLDEWDYIKGNKDLHRQEIKEEPQQLGPQDCEYEDKRDITADLGGTLCYNNEPSKIGAEGAEFWADGNLPKLEISPPANGIKEESISWEGENQSDCSNNPFTEPIQGTDTPTPNIVMNNYSESHSAEAELFMHQKTDMTVKPFVCSVCGTQFGCNSDLIEHQRSHTGKKAFTGSPCGKTFTDCSDLQIHEKNHTAEKPFSCSECGKWFTQRSRLNAHLRVHTGEKPFPCSECGKCFSDRSGLRTHKKFHTGEKPFSCSECRKCFTNHADLIIHLRTHTGEKPFSCSDCGKSFIQRSGLTAHLRIHTGEKLFSCSECEKWFTTRAELNKHLRIHTGEKPFSCSECGKCFARRQNLTLHLRVHTGEKPYTCTE